MKLSESDHVDRVRAQWAAERPDLDTRPFAVVGRVGRLARYFDQGMERLFSEHGLRRESWDVLASLRRAGAPYRLSPTALYLGLMRTSGAMTNRLHRLEHAGLISRVQDPADGRGLLVQLTPRGRLLVDELAATHMANERAMLAALTPHEQRTLARLLAKLLATLETQEGGSPSAHCRRAARRSPSGDDDAPLGRRSARNG